MSCSTWQKFQGVWLGSLVTTLNLKEEGQKYSENWLFERRTIAAQVVKASHLDINSLAGIEQLLSTVDDKNAEQNFTKPKHNPLNVLNQHKSAKNEDILLYLLPLIIFFGNNQELLQKSLDNYVLKSQITVEEQEDILIWSRLLYLSFNHKLTSQDTNCIQIIRQVLNEVRIKTSDLPNKLEIVIRAWEQGLSLYELTEKLNGMGNQIQIAISSAVYCFTTTPRYFELAVKRAGKASIPKRLLTSTLTATLSGAYNGVTGIPWNWRASANKQKIYQSELQLAGLLFEVWLGIYSPANSLCSYNQELDAVAQARGIQARKALKIISQI